MTPKEKAIELVNKYKNASFNCNDCAMLFCDIKCTMLSNEESKQCALISVDLALEFLGGHIVKEFDKVLYLIEVKKEIEKL